MKTETSYLHHLKFDSKLKNSFIAKYLSNPRLVLLLLLSVVGIGTASYTSLPRRVNPEIKIPIVVVSTVLPGANPKDIESLVTQPVEDGIASVANIKTVSSTSQENVSVVQVEFNSGIDTEKARTDIQSAIDQVELPTDALTPKVIKVDFENQPVWTFTLIGKGDVASLSRFATKLKTDLENQQSIDNVSTSGLETREISVVVEPSKIATYGISPFQLSSLVKASVGSFPAGSVVTENSNFALSIDPAVTSIEDVRNLQLNLNGTVVPLSSIATITERSKPNQSASYFASRDREPERSITFNVYKTSTANIDKATKDADKVVHTDLKQYEGQFQTLNIINSGELINEQFTHLIRDFSITIVLVFLVLFVFLGARQAFVSFFAVPLTFLISFSVMKFAGISLNFLSMFSLLLSLGLLVDDTIVVISAMTSYFKSGKFTPLETGILVWKDFLIPVLTTTLTTVWAFFPLLLSTGIIGEFIKAIPIVVSSTLLASLGVAMLITIPLMMILLKPQIPSRVVIFFRILLVLILLMIFFAIVPKGPFLPLAFIALFLFLFVTAKARLALVRRSSKFLHKTQNSHKTLKKAPSFVDNGVINFERFSKRYRSALARILATERNRRRAVIMVVIFSLFSYLLVPLGFVRNEFFPKSDQDFVYVSVELPAGTNTETAQKETLSLLQTLRKTKNVSYVTADVGQAFTQSGGPGGAGNNNILYSLVLPKNRTQTSIDIADNLRSSLGTYTAGKLAVVEESGGPPAGADLQIKLFGDDIPKLDSYADKVVSYLEKQKGVTDISKSIKPGTGKIVFVPNQTKLAQNNITQDQLGFWLRSFASGFTLDSVKFGNEPTAGNSKQDITFRMSTDLQNVSDISSLVIPTQNGNLFLSSLGSFKLETNPTLITREDGKRTISISATVTKGYTTSVLNKELESYADSDLRLPEGYSWKTGGVNEENQNSVTSILAAMLLSFLLIIVTMVIQFGSFRKAIIVMLVIPLSISGVFIVFALTKTPLSFPALIGVLALFGIVVKNAILVVDKINANLAIGMRFVDSIVDASESRLEPIALTSLATICGLIPITISDPLWRGLGGAIIAGLLFSGTIMLFFIPVVYYSWFNPTKESSRRK